MKNTPQQIFQACSHDFIGLPYGSYDCWDLVRYFHHKVMSQDYDIHESLYDPNDENQASQLILKHSEKFLQIKEPKFGDIMMLRVHGLPAHLGIYLNEKNFLHTTERTGSIIDKIDTWEKRILGYYRYDQSKD